MAKLKEGSNAPAFSLQDQDGNTVKLADFKGEHLLVYFYPRANTPGCTKQSCSVSESRGELSRLGIKAIGISPDTPKRQKNFDQKHSLGFPLLSDEAHETARAFGAFGMKTMCGKKKEGIIRSSFLIDKKGKILKAWYGVKPADTVPNALSALKDEN